jgi:hypothetical protein
VHRATEEQAQRECEWKRGKGVLSWIAGALVITLTLTRAAFSWKFALAEVLPLAIASPEQSRPPGPPRLPELLLEPVRPLTLSLQLLPEDALRYLCKLQAPF